MTSLIANAVATATHEFGEPPSSFTIEYSQYSSSATQTVGEVSLCRRASDPITIVGQLLIIAAAPVMLAANMWVGGQFAIFLALLVLIAGIGLRLARRWNALKTGRSRTFIVSANTPPTAPS